MKKRWYDMHPTVSMAISLMQNTRPDIREKSVEYLKNVYHERFPKIADMLNEEPSGFWTLKLIQKRQSMSENAWTAVETMRYLSDEDRENLAIELIRFIYCLENDEEMASLGAFEDLEAVM